MATQPPAAPAPPSPYSDGHLHARPALRRAALRQPGAPLPLPPGRHTLAFGNGRQAILHVPPQAGGATARPLQLIVLLHGVRQLLGGADDIALAHATRHGALLLIPRSLTDSWDVIRGGYGPDVAFLDRALAWTMRRYDVDAQAVVIGGFSDGASYALSVGLMNGDLFSDILAFSPGFMKPLRRVDRPRVFVAHGSGDLVLPVERGRAIAAQLATEAYDVRYAEFDGAHVVSAPIAREALRRISER
ncbi:MAG TPA: thioesterase [Duganella sp.]|uniref:alpha/beta hydrolase n=1 Tax=Duganella sp. TaxID=1904440 RepID=UPI002ED0CDF1